jgi:hypothetical protein
MVDLVLGMLAWLGIIFATMLGVHLVVHTPSIGTGLIAGVAVGLLVLNVSVLLGQPRYRWGRLVDPSGGPWSNADIKLVGPGGSVASSYHTDASGRYTLYADPGEYQLVVSQDEVSLHEEPVRIRRRPTYLGFKLKLSRA